MEPWAIPKTGNRVEPRIERELSIHIYPLVAEFRVVAVLGQGCAGHETLHRLVTYPHSRKSCRVATPFPVHPGYGRPGDRIGSTHHGTTPVSG
jgi:hypothetical protein